MNVDPLFPQNKLADHEVGYPGFTFIIPGPLAEMKVKEIKNGRLAMLAFVGEFCMQAFVHVACTWHDCSTYFVLALYEQKLGMDIQRLQLIRMFSQHM